MLYIIFFAPYIEKVMKSNIFLKYKLLKASLASADLDELPFCQATDASNNKIIALFHLDLLLKILY